MRKNALKHHDSKRSRVQILRILYGHDQERQGWRIQNGSTIMCNTGIYNWRVWDYGQ